MTNRVTQVVRQTAIIGDPPARVTQVAKMIAVSGNAPARVTQVAKMVALSAQAKVRVTQVSKIVAFTGQPKARVTQVAKLVALKPIFYNVGGFLNASNKVNSSSVVGTTTTEILVNQIAVIILASDNEGMTDSNTTLHSSVVIGGYNAIKIREYTAGRSAINAGATVSAWYLIAPDTIANGSNVTANFAVSKTAKAMCGHVFRKDSPLDLHIVGFTDLAGTNNNPASMTLTGDKSTEHIWIRGIAVESDNTTIGRLSPTAGWSEISGTGTTGSTADTNMSVRAEYAFRMGISSGVSDPSHSGTADNANILFGLTVVSESYDEIASGGSVLSGSAEILKESYQTNSGGSIIGGSEKLDTISQIIPTGGSNLNGTSNIYIEYDILSLTNVQLNGESLVEILSEQSASGGIVLNGMHESQVTYEVVQDGGCVLNGISEVQVKYDFLSLGQIQLNGASIVEMIYETSASGGLIGNSGAGVLLEFEYVLGPETSIVIGGLNNCLILKNEEMSGGVVLSGLIRITTRIMPKRVRPKYTVGKQVYVHCAVMCCYVKQSILKIDQNEYTFIYDCGIGWFTEDVILSIEEFERLKDTDEGNSMCVQRSE